MIFINQWWYLLQCKEILQEEEDLSEIVQLVGKVTLTNCFWHYFGWDKAIGGVRPSLDMMHIWRHNACLYRENAIAIESEASDSLT